MIELLLLIQILFDDSEESTHVVGGPIVDPLG
jgi:hypothetical protein